VLQHTQAVADNIPFSKAWHGTGRSSRSLGYLLECPWAYLIDISDLLSRPQDPNALREVLESLLRILARVYTVRNFHNATFLATKADLPTNFPAISNAYLHLFSASIHRSVR